MSQRPDLRTGDQALVREINLSVIMKHLREHAPISRATSAETTGLSKTTMSSLVTELTECQFVHEAGLDSSGVGRPAILIELNPEAGSIVSAEIGVDFISVIRTNFAPDITWQCKESIDSKVGYRTTIEQGRTSALSEMAEGDLAQLTIPMVIDTARQGDQVALQVLDTVGHDLGIGVASLLNALNPDLVVFGGILSLATEFLLPPVESELEQRALDWNRTATSVVPARHGFDACVMGGVAAIYQTILAQPSNAERVLG